MEMPSVQQDKDSAPAPTATATPPRQISRAGCNQCKVRKVKCDEAWPQCGNCQRRTTECVYVRPEKRRRKNPALGRHSRLIPNNGYDNDGTMLDPDVGGNQQNRGNSHHMSSIDGNPSSSMRSETLNLSDLELMHHFTAVTSIALTQHMPHIPGTEDGYVRDMWHLYFPALAFSHEFLMHGLLALTAMHLAHVPRSSVSEQILGKVPEQKETYWARAMKHQDRALQLSQSAVANPNENNADAIFAFTVLVSHYAFNCSVGSQEPLDEERPFQATIQCLKLLQGYRLVIPSISQWIFKGPLGPILNSNTHTKTASSFKDAATDEYLTRLLLYCSNSATDSIEDAELFSASASSLRMSFLRTESLPPKQINTPSIMAWAVRLPTAFYERLGEKSEAAMILIAHYCALVIKIEHYWWIPDWVERTMAEVKHYLPQDLAHWLEWPQNQIANANAMKST